MMNRPLSVLSLLTALILALIVAACDKEPPPTETIPPDSTDAATPTGLAATDVAPSATPVPAATQTPVPQTFDGSRAFSYVEAQVEFGPRWPGSPGHEAVGDYIVSQTQEAGWEVEEQLFEYRGVQGRNIIARANKDEDAVILLGAHYDTRRIADQTPGAAEDSVPVPGAVDGASGVAVLLELAQALDLESIPYEIWLAFFDLEDNGDGGIDNWDWIVGSRYMAENLTIAPRAVVVVDMIGDADQQLYYEGNSTPELQQELWGVAADLGFEDAFIPELRHTMIDDHLPFKQRGFPTALIIDFDYPYWHTVEDTVDKVSSDSLFRVGRTIEVWLEEHRNQESAIGGNY